MSLRSGQPAGTLPKQLPEQPMLSQFSLFSLLPVEIRQMIWKMTLQPRTIEILHPRDKASYYCLSNLPCALGVSQDSRAAVIGLYPYCFTSRMKSPSIRFNFALDTLFLAEEPPENGGVGESILHFLDILTDHEASRIQHLAIEENCGDDALNPGAEQAFWGLVEKSLSFFSSLRELSVVRRIDLELCTSDLDYAILYDANYICELFDYYPPQLDPSDEMLRDLWLWGTELKAKLVWGWRRQRYPGIEES